MKKKCLILILGLIKKNSIIEKTSVNLFNNIINNNTDYEFKIIINLSFNYTDSKKFKNKKGSIDTNDLNEKISTLYNNYDIHDYDPFINGIKYLNDSGTPFKSRLNYELKNNNLNLYDKIIFIRPDTMLSGKIDLNNYDGFNSICRDIKKGGGASHDRDWDYCWIGDRKPFKAWSYILTRKFSRIYDDEVLIDYDLYEKESIKFGIENNMEYITKKYLDRAKLKPARVNEYKCHFYTFIYLFNLGYNVSFSNKYRITTKIIRS